MRALVIFCRETRAFLLQQIILGKKNLFTATHCNDLFTQWEDGKAEQMHKNDVGEKSVLFRKKQRVLARHHYCLAHANRPSKSARLATRLKISSDNSYRAHSSILTHAMIWGLTRICWHKTKRSYSCLPSILSQLFHGLALPFTSTAKARRIGLYRCLRQKLTSVYKSLLIWALKFFM